MATINNILYKLIHAHGFDFFGKVSVEAEELLAFLCVPPHLIARRHENFVFGSAWKGREE